MRSKRKRPGRCRASFIPKKNRWLKTTTVILILCITVASLLYAAKVEEKTQNLEKVQEAKPANITIQQPCKTGTVTVYAQDQIIYQYNGEITIRNDGKDGEQIEIVVEYPDKWPCSCFEEE